jgi:predicted N-formylglutamate amidohydrolase
MTVKWLLTCEHAGHDIPVKYKHLFNGARNALISHRGYDKGALSIYNALKPHADADFHNLNTRLLVDLNRSAHNRTVFSSFIKPLTLDEKRQLIEEHHKPYRDKVIGQVKKWIDKGYLVHHVGVHTFIPELDGEVRDADIGLLFDSGRRLEREWAYRWKHTLDEVLPGKRVRFNHPYTGRTDGLSTTMRKMFGGKFLGIELEINQNFVKDNKLSKEVLDPLVQSYQEVKSNWAVNV